MINKLCFCFLSLLVFKYSNNLLPPTTHPTHAVPGVVSCMSRWTSHSASSVSVTWSPPENENGVTLMYTLRLVQYGRTGEAIVEAIVSSTERNYTLTGGFLLGMLRNVCDTSV